MKTMEGKERAYDHEIDGDGGPAYPSADSFTTENGVTRFTGGDGMSLRDWFAGQALCGLLACTDAESEEPDSTARTCYRMADAMLEARSK